MHRLLARQIRKHLGDQARTPEVDALLEKVDQAYQAADEDRRLLERAMDLTSTELMERNQRLAETLAKLQVADDVRKQFINNAAHELGTPLTPLKLQIYSLKSRTNADRDRAAIELLERNVDRIIMLVGDLLDSAKIQSGRLNLTAQTVDVSQCVEGAVESHRELAKQEGLEITVDASGQCGAAADPARIQQVLDNLLGNAIKFTPTGGRIHATVGCTPEWVEARITDTGPGIAAEAIGQLFQPFSQLENPKSRTRAGTGLGLYVSRGIIEASGGTIGVESDGSGKGSTFWFRLPATT